FVTLFESWRLPFNVHDRRPAVSGQRYSPCEGCVLHARQGGNTFESLAMEVAPRIPVLHVSDAHGQDFPHVVTGGHRRDFCHGPNEESGSDKKSKRERGLQYGDALEETALADGRCSFRAGIL